MQRPTALPLAAIFLLAPAASHAQAQPAPPAAAATSTALPPALEATIAQSREALRKILNGDPSGYAALFADRDDITLGNPFGPFGRGRAEVLKALGNAASKYSDGQVVGVDRVAVYGGDPLFVLVEIERIRAKLGKSAEHSEFAARVTTVFERIGVHSTSKNMRKALSQDAEHSEKSLKSLVTSTANTFGIETNSVPDEPGARVQLRKRVSLGCTAYWQTTAFRLADPSLS
jgi:hypothetical protein